MLPSQQKLSSLLVKVEVLSFFHTLFAAASCFWCVFFIYQWHLAVMGNPPRLFQSLSPVL